MFRSRVRIVHVLLFSEIDQRPFPVRVNRLFWSLPLEVLEGDTEPLLEGRSELEPDDERRRVSARMSSRLTLR